MPNSILLEYEENLHAYGYSDPLVILLRKQLDRMDDESVNVEVQCINHDFDLAVFNNQTEGRF
jgi:hypothetical protein